MYIVNKDNAVIVNARMKIKRLVWTSNHLGSCAKFNEKRDLLCSLWNARFGEGRAGFGWQQHAFGGSISMCGQHSGLDSQGVHSETLALLKWRCSYASLLKKYVSMYLLLKG